MKMMFRNVVEEEATRNYNNAVKTAETRGREEGRAEGEKKAKIESAKNLLKAGVDINIIATAVGLSVDEVERLR